MRDRCIEMVLIKKDTDGKFWAQLPKDKNKFKNTCKADWDRWIDEDEEIDKSKLGGMGDLMGGGGFPGMVRVICCAALFLVQNARARRIRRASSFLTLRHRLFLLLNSHHTGRHGWYGRWHARRHGYVSK